MVPRFWSPSTAKNSLLGGITPPCASLGSFTFPSFGTPLQSWPTTLPAAPITLLSPPITALIPPKIPLISPSSLPTTQLNAAFAPFLIPLHKPLKNPPILSTAVLKILVIFFVT